MLHTVSLRDNSFSGYGTINGNPSKRLINSRSFFWKILLLIGSFYLLPSLQFVIFQSYATDGSNVVCHFNPKCSHPASFPFKMHSFNNVISNIGYIVLGLLFILIVRCKAPTIEEIAQSDYGVHKDPAMYYAIGCVMILEGLASGIYHICPSELNFQFDTTFMFMGIGLMFVTLYQKRHITRYISPFKVYNFLSFIILTNIFPLAENLSHSTKTFLWVVTFTVLVSLMTLGSAHFYYNTDHPLDWSLVYNNLKSCLTCPPQKPEKPLTIAFIIVANIFTLTMAIIGTVYKPEFTMWMLFVFIINLVLYFTYYIVMKYRNRERVHNCLWIITTINLVVVGSALYFFNKSIDSTSELTDSLNEECTLFGYFDTHDIWHFLSSISIFIYILIVYCIDNDLNWDHRDNIAVF
jgi:hypothetical protein